MSRVFTPESSEDPVGTSQRTVQFSLRALLGVMLLFAASGGLLKWSIETQSIICGAIAGRGLAIASVSAAMTLIVGNLTRAMLAALVSVVWSDFAWVAVLVYLGGEPKLGGYLFLVNPLAIFALIASPAATATMPKQLLRWTMFLAGAVPISVVLSIFVYVLKYPADRGPLGVFLLIGAPLVTANSAFCVLLGKWSFASMDRAITAKPSDLPTQKRVSGFSRRRAE